MGATSASQQSSSSLKDAEGVWPACQMSSPPATGRALNLLSPPASSVGSVSSSGEKKMSACRFSGQSTGVGLGLGSPMAANSYSLDSVHFSGGPQSHTGSRPQSQQQQQQYYNMNDMNAGQQPQPQPNFPVLPPAFGSYSGGVASGAGQMTSGTTAAASGSVGVAGMMPVHHQMANPVYDLMPGAHSSAAAAAAAAARSCALPSPTIYPPTPPPSAPWVHPWFLGDTF